jgi:hypothetical protein
MGKLIKKFCKALDIEVPKNENASDLVVGVLSAWAIVALGYATMRLVYGG